MPLRGAHASSVLQAVRHVALSLPRCKMRLFAVVLALAHSIDTGHGV